MNAIEINSLYKTFHHKQALSGLTMTVPEGAIYGFIGENGSGKSTTEKIICGLIPSNSGTVALYGKANTNAQVRSNIGLLIEQPGCFPNQSVWNNMRFQAANLGIKNPNEEISRVLKLVRMEGSAANKYKNCSLGMKQRIGIAMALLGSPKLLILDEPINGLDADGMRIMRECLMDLTQNHGTTVLISSHILSELEKIATHYGIIRHGKMIKEMSAWQLEQSCPTYVYLTTNDNYYAKSLLSTRYNKVLVDENDIVRVYDAQSPSEVATYLYDNNSIVTQLGKAKISLEDFYIDLMKEGA